MSKNINILLLSLAVMPLKTLFAKCSFYRTSLICSGIFGASSGCVAILGANSPKAYVFGFAAIGFGYMAHLAHRSSSQEYSLLEKLVEQDGTFMPALANEPHRIVELYARINDLEESFKFDVVSFKKLESIYRNCGMGAIVRNKLLLPYSESWAKATARIKEYEAAVRAIGDV